MIKKENRLQGKRTVGKILSRGSSFKTEHFSCRYLLANREGAARLTVVVGRKVSGLAVTRNSIKRRVREAFSGEIGNARSINLVVFPNKTALDAPFENLKKEARKCLEKAPSS
jgi:ribonuclease P protein component